MTGLDRRRFLAAVPTVALAAPALAAADTPAPAATEERSGPKFTLGMVTYNVAATWDVPTILKVCKAAGISPVELRTTHKHGVEPKLTKEERAEVRKRFADTGVAIWGCGTTCEFHSPKPEVVEKQIETCKQFIELAADLGAKGVKVRPNALPKGVEPARTLEQIGKALIPCGKAAADAGVEVWVEVHGPGTQEPANMKAIMEHADHPKVGLTWNSNPTDVKGGSVAESFKLLSPWVRSCHINELHKDAAGKYPYRELFSLLKRVGYDRATLIEIGRSWPDSDAATEMLRYYKALWLELCRG
jgi:sugar phosphate isomerase/epimerase